MNKILLIGCGHMGSALLEAWTKQTKNIFSVIDPKQHVNISKKFTKRVSAFKTIKQIKNIVQFDIIIFAIKPQLSKNILQEFKFYQFKDKTVFISIIAGKKINFFYQFLKKETQFIRIMPNMPAMINEGMSCLIDNNKVTSKNKKKIEFLFNMVGETLWLKSESDINKVTAISGSGPGYIFSLIDAFEKSAMQLGLGEKVTKKLVHQTFDGSIKLFIAKKISAKILAKNIAVKGGTTEAGLNEFKKNQILNKIFTKVIKAAYNRANLLGKKN